MSTADIAKAGKADGHALQYWEPRRALTLDAARRHSIFVHRARFVLMGFAALLVIMLGWYFINAPKPPTPSDNPDETVKMVNPIYKGRTSEGLPYRIMADDAIRFINKPNEVRLTNPILNFLREDGASESIILATSGLYQSEKQVLELNSDVNLKTDNGYDCKTGHARIFVDGKRIEGDKPISCTGDFGQAGGNAFEINDNYSEFVFKNGMTAKLIPEKADSIFGPTDLRGAQDQ